jgi:hypothetical protein
MNWLFIIYFGFLLMRLSQSYDPNYEFGGLTQVESVLLLSFFKISSSNIEFIENWASWFIFYGVIRTSWHGSQVWLVNIRWLELLFHVLLFNWIFLFYFHSSTLDWLENRLHNLFWFIFHEVILISWLGSWFLQVN